MGINWHLELDHAVNIIPYSSGCAVERYKLRPVINRTKERPMSVMDLWTLPVSPHLRIDVGWCGEDMDHNIIHISSHCSTWTNMRLSVCLSITAIVVVIPVVVVCCVADMLTMMVTRTLCFDYGYILIDYYDVYIWLCILCNRSRYWSGNRKGIKAGIWWACEAHEIGTVQELRCSVKELIHVP